MKILTNLMHLLIHVFSSYISGNVSNIVAQKADVNKFNPIHQHRPFCPWVVFKENKNSPGWKLTLQALVNDNSSPRAAAALSTEEVGVMI